MAHLRDPKTGKITGTTSTEAQSKARNLWTQRKEDKLLNATKRQETRSACSDKQQLERLDFLLGEGEGATKERARLLVRIEEPKPTSLAEGRRLKAKKERRGS